MKQHMSNVSLLCSLLIPFGAIAAPTVEVYDEKSLRAALESGSNNIVIKANTGNIMVTESLKYQGKRPLSIVGSGQVIYDMGLDDGEPILYVSGGADLSLSNLSFQGPGGYSIQKQGGGKGIYLQVPSDRQGFVNLNLTQVSVSDTGHHGIHVSDCSLGDDCGGGQGGGGGGSPASIQLQLNGVTIDRVGFGKQDADGIRVDDRGDGDIILSMTNSTFTNVGGDGIELDEGDAGSVQIDVRNSRFENNGAYCSDELVDDPIQIDPACDEKGDPDVDDAFDIDEDGPGGIFGLVSGVEIIGSYDEGLDFDTAGEGDDNSVDLDFIDIYATGNADEAIKVSEEGDASVVINMRAINIEGDVDVAEKDDGDLRVTIDGSTIGGHLTLSQKGAGTGSVKLQSTKVVGDLDFNNVDEI